MPSLVKKLRPEEWVILAFIAFIVTVRSVVGSSIEWTRVAGDLAMNALGWVVGLILVLWILFAVETLYRVTIKNREIGSPLAFLKDVRYPRDFLPFLLLSAIFYQLGGAIAMTHFLVKTDMTYVMMSLDQSLLGCQASIALQDYTRPWITEVMSFLYSLHPIFTVGLALFFYRNNDTRAFRNLMLAVVLSSIIAYTSFMMLPAASPVYVLDYRVGLDGSTITKTLDYVFSNLRSATSDCCLFPSLHVALSAIALFASYQYKDKRLVYFLVPFIVGSWISTVYLRRHFVVDVIAGFVLAVFCVYASPRINEWWYGWKKV